MSVLGVGHFNYYVVKRSHFNLVLYILFIVDTGSPCVALPGSLHRPLRLSTLCSLSVVSKSGTRGPTFKAIIFHSSLWVWGVGSW